MARYDGVRFTAGASGTGHAAACEAPVALYRQDGDLVWGEFAGGHVRRGSLVGTCDEDGVLHITYCMVLTSGDIVSGRSISTPTTLPDGRIQLRERWERYGPHRATGISYLEERPSDDGPES